MTQTLSLYSNSDKTKASGTIETKKPSCPPPLFAPKSFCTQVEVDSSPSSGEVKVGCFGLIEKRPNKRITYVNGILNQENDCIDTAMFISTRHCNTKVYYVFHQTKGMVKDVISTLQLMRYERELEAVDKLAKLWKKQLSEIGPNGSIRHFCHSRGGLITYYALQKLSAEEKKKIEVINFGSPAEISEQDCGSVLNISNQSDLIPLVNPSRWFWESKEIIIPSKARVFEHEILSEAYAEQINILGENY